MEPYVGGRWYERGEDGSECNWGKVLAWEPPRRVVFAWQINSKGQYDPSLLTTVEVRFIAEALELTRVELEHRDLDQLGEEGEAVRNFVDAPQGWGFVLGTYAKHAENSHVA
jgi:Activator of Hsp90 ATPase homolog 1-like protein.